jgi:hypothetical protein
MRELGISGLQSSGLPGTPLLVQITFREARAQLNEWRTRESYSFTFVLSFQYVIWAPGEAAQNLW